MTAVQAERMTPEKARAFGSRCEHALVEVLAAYTDWLDKVDDLTGTGRDSRAILSTRRLCLADILNFLAGNNDPDRVGRSYGRNGGES